MWIKTAGEKGISKNKNKKTWTTECQRSRFVSDTKDLQRKVIKEKKSSTSETEATTSEKDSQWKTAVEKGYR